MLLCKDTIIPPVLEGAGLQKVAVLKHDFMTP